MPPTTIQVPSIVLPLLTVQAVGTLTENINDAAEHTSEEFVVEYLQEKQVHITATEAVALGVPGNLLCWIELSPVPTTISAAYWAAIGGGGGAIVPVTPHVEMGTGVNLREHGIIMAWSIHSVYARVVIQTPVPLATAFWVVNVVITGKAV